MSRPGWEILGDSNVLTQLSEAQLAHRNTFLGILEDIRSSNTTVKGQWEGAGLDEKNADDTSYEEYYQEAMAAFDKLITATDENAATWQQLMSRMQLRFGR